MTAARLFVRLSLSRRLIHVAGGVCLIVAWVLCVADPACPEITRETYGRIREGMTLRQVSAIVGAPPGHWGWWWRSWDAECTEESWAGKGVAWKSWDTPEGNLTVHFTADWRACAKGFSEPGLSRRERTLREKLRLYVFRKLHGG
jgi:hypothetical protein